MDELTGNNSTFWLIILRRRDFESRGGYTIKSTFFGSLCICELASDNPRSNPCKSPLCIVCHVVRLGFDENLSGLVQQGP